VTIVHIVLLLAAGAVTGFLAGLFGVGGGILLVPILLYYFQSIGVSSLVATHLTFGTSLLVVMFASLVSALQYAKNGHVVPKAVLVIGLTSAATAAVGAMFAAGLKGPVLQKIFAAIVLVAAVRLLTEGRSTHEAEKLNLALPGLLGIGVVVGFISSLAGVGGGVFSIPMMYYFLRFPLKKALGTSSATIVITATAATLGYVIQGWEAIDVYAPQLSVSTLGYVDYLHALPLIAGTLLMARFGAMVAHRTQVDRLRTYYAVFLLGIAIKMFFF
jgi:uncharacterized membrane protein YfcA